MTPETKMDAIKATSAWAAIGITNWAEAAQAAAAIYSVLLIIEFVWKRFLRERVSRCWPNIVPPRNHRRRADFVNSTGPSPMGD